MVYTFGSSKPENIETDVVEFGLYLRCGFTMHLRANVINTITGKIQRFCVKDDVREKSKCYELFDTLPSVAESTYVDLLVGNDYYADIVLLQSVVINNGLYLLQSKVGWVLSGRVV